MNASFVLWLLRRPAGLVLMATLASVDLALDLALAESARSQLSQPQSSQPQSSQFYDQFQSVTPPVPAADPALPPSIASPIPAVPTTPVRVPAATPPQPTNPDLVVTATDVRIVGATAELEPIARSTVRTRSGGGTSQVQLREDVAALLNTGFFASASVSTQANRQGLSVTFQVQPAIVRSLRLANAQILTLDVVNQLFGDQIGKPVSPAALRSAVQRTNAWFVQNGYSVGRVLTVEPTREGVLIIDVAEGLVGAVRIRYVDRTGSPLDEKGQPIQARSQEAFVRRQILLQPGQVFRQDVVQADVRRLGQLGIFEGVTVTLEGDARRADVVYNLVEAKSRGFNFGGGFNEDLGLYGTITFQDTNFGGLAQRLTTSVQVGTRDVQFDGRFVSPYRSTEPGVPGYGANLFRRQGVSRVFDDEIKLANGDRVRERRIGGGVNLEYPVGQDFLGTFGVNYTRTSLRDRDGNLAKTDVRGNPLSLSGTGIDDLVTLSFNATRDLRDNPINPSRGSVLTIGTAQSLPIGLGSILSNRLSANYAQFFPVGWIQGGRDNQFPQVVGFNLQAGTVLGDLPPYDAYTIGGTNSVRGYGDQEVAVSRTYFLASAEYRFPIYRFIGGVAFLDFGSDVGTQDNVLGQPGIQRDRPGIGFGYGLGLRLNSPIGILRLDLGLNDQGESKLHFGFGQKF